MLKSPAPINTSPTATLLAPAQFSATPVSLVASRSLSSTTTTSFFLPKSPKTLASSLLIAFFPKHPSPEGFGSSSPLLEPFPASPEASPPLITATSFSFFSLPRRFVSPNLLTPRLPRSSLPLHHRRRASPPWPSFCRRNSSLLSFLLFGQLLPSSSLFLPRS